MNRLRSPLLVSASAISRACDPNHPSRTTVLRLLGDALHTLEESQQTVNAIKARAAAQTQRNPQNVLPRQQLEADNRTRSAHEQGARALFTAVTAVLLKLPSRAGPLFRRAAALLAASAAPAGPAVAMQAAQNVRDHILSLKRLVWSDTERTEFSIVCSVTLLTLVSSVPIAGREVAYSSIQFLLSQRVRQKCKRSDLAFAIASIIQSFSQHVPPGDRMVDQLLEFGLSANAVKQGNAGVGSALLVALVVPHLVSRGPPPSDEVTAACARALRSAPIAVERAMWAVAMARASVTARRSSTFQLRKYGNSQTGSKFPGPTASFNRRLGRPDSEMEDSDPSLWISDDVFEEALIQVASASGLTHGRLDSFISIGSVIRMWSQALPDSAPVILPRIFAKLLSGLTLVSSVSALVDGIWLGLLKDLKPTQSLAVFDSLLPTLSEQSDLSLSAALHLCSSLIFRFGRQVIRESALSVEYKCHTINLIKQAHEALDVSSHFVRMAGVRLMSALISALPRTSSQFLTAVLQNLRIADLTLAMKLPSTKDLRTFASLISIENELSSMLGNAAALSVLILKISSGGSSVPAALVRQCAVDSLALLRTHQAGDVASVHGVIADCIRRRAGWGLFVALIRGKGKRIFEEVELKEMISMWKEELGLTTQTSSRKCFLNGAVNPLAGKVGTDVVVDTSPACFDELLALSSTRAAALNALACTLRLARTEELVQMTEALISACAGRIVSTQMSFGISTPMGTFSPLSSGDAVLVADVTGDKRHSVQKLSRMLSAESVELLSCVSLVPPGGDTGELCYFLALSLGEDAQSVLGEVAGAGSSDFVQSSSTESSTGWGAELDSTMANHRHSLSRDFYEGNDNGIAENFRRRHKIGRGKNTNKLLSDVDGESDSVWMFSLQGTSVWMAEDVLAKSAVGVAAIVAADLSASGSLVESLSSGQLSPCFSAAVTLELSRRLSRSNLAEINRALAVVQVLAKRALAVTGGSQRTILQEGKGGRLPIPNQRGDSANFNPIDCPGAVLHKLINSKGWLGWAKTFSDEGLLGRIPLIDFHARSRGIMYATRAIAAEAHRELGTTGGPKLWIGLMKRVITVVKDSSDCLTPNQSIIHANGIAALGALLEVVPEPLKCLRGSKRSSHNGVPDDLPVDLDTITEEAVNVLADTIEYGDADAQITAALALSNCSQSIASSSERLVGALLKAWANDNGDCGTLGQGARCLSDVEVWTRSFSHIWKDMGIRVKDSVRFFAHDTCGSTACSPALATGTAAVLSSCRLHWWPLSESCLSSVTEISTELLQWAGTSSRRARAAGLYSMSEIWAARIDTARLTPLSTDSSVEMGSAHSFSVLKGEGSEYPPILPVQMFSLKDPTRIASTAGPFLDEILYDALAPGEGAPCFDELHSAGTAAVMEIIRGAGAKETCMNLPRLPECLFETVEAGSPEADELLCILVKTDAKSRPRYWFGLCRAVCLGGDRLNVESARTSWDVSYGSRACAAKLVVEAVDISLANCRCDATSSFLKHECAYGFLRKLCAFVEELCSSRGFDFEACSEGCRLLQVLASQIGFAGASWKSTDKTLKDFRDIWDSCLSMMEKLLVDKVPYSVVNNASLAVAELLVSFLRLWKVSFFESAQGTVAFFLNKAVGRDLNRELLYADQGEEVGLFATLALISNYAKVVTALRTSAEAMEDPLVAGYMSLQISRKLFFATTGDFIAALDREGLRDAAENGGALTPGMISASQLQAALYMHIAPIILGAVSCVGEFRDLDEGEIESTWVNEHAAGARMAESGHMYDEVAVGCLVWLLKHEHDSLFSQTPRLPFNSQCRETLVSLCCNKGNGTVNVREVLVSCAQWNKIEYLQFVAAISNHGDVPLAIDKFIVELTLTVLRDMFADELDPASRSKPHIVSEAVTGLMRLSSRVSGTSEQGSRQSTVHVLDTLFHVVNASKGEFMSMYSDVGFQKAICRCLSNGLEELGDSVITAQLCISKVKEVFWYGCKENSLPHVKISTAIGSTMCGILSEEADRDFVQLLLTPVVFDADEELSIPALSTVLDCHGIEGLIVKMLRNLSPQSKDSSLGNIITFVYQLGRIGLSQGKFSVPAALRSAIAAIHVESSEENIVNRLGLVLYSIFLSKLVLVLPRADSVKSEPSKLSNSSKFLVDVVERGDRTLTALVTSLRDDERETVKLFLQALET